MKRKLLVLVGVFLALAFFFVSRNNEEGLKDNYYQSINADVIYKNQLEDGEYSWSYFLKAQEEVDNDTNLVVNDILNGKIEGIEPKEINTIKKVYNKVLDIDERNTYGIKDLEYYLNLVWDISSVDKLVDVIILIEKDLGIDLLTNIEVVQDYKDNDKNIIYFYPITYAFGASSDYIVNDDYMTYKAYIRRACVQLWKSYGYNSKESREVVSRIFNFYENISKYSKLASDLEEIDSYYNIVSEDDINSLFSQVDNKYLSRRGINGYVYSLVDKKQYQALNDSLTKDNLDVWKEVIITKILSSYASYASSEYVEVVNNLNEALLGSSKDLTNEEMAINMVKNLFSSEIDKGYENKFLTNEHIEEIKDMFLEIKEAYKIRIKNNEWLSENAKDMALAKLDKMRIIVGSENVLGYEIANNLEVSDNSLIKDVIEIQKLFIDDEIKRLKNGEKRNLVDQTLVNAYYQPLDNSIVIPVAFFELIDDDYGYYERLGTLGMILAHEVTHAFDGNGSKFDSDGNLVDWWSEEDKNRFIDLKQEVIDYYSKLEVIDGKYINGEKTVNENIADLGAVACVVDIANKRGASNDEFRTMFSALASIWVSVESDEYMNLLLLQDVHAPNQFRVNAVLSSIEKFYQVYNIYPWNDMWISKDNRVMIW